MHLRTSLGLLLAAILLAACSGGPQPTAQPQVTLPPLPTAAVVVVQPSPGYPAPNQAGSGYPYPVPAQVTPAPWEPKPGDDALQRAEVTIDSSEILVPESFPPQYRLHLVGSLPTPCHELRVAVAAPDSENRIYVEVYSLVDPSKACAQVIQPFDELIWLQYYKTGRTTAWVNGEEVKERTP